MERGRSLRERLIDAGVELVMSGGAGSLGLREIARRAGVSHGAPRRYFPTHHALLSAIAHRGFADLGARFAAAIGTTASPREQLRALGRVYVGYALAHRGMFELMFRHDLLDSETHGSTEETGPTEATGPAGSRLRESTLPLFESIVGLVARCQTQPESARPPAGPLPATPSPAGPLPDVPPPAVTAAALWANLHGIAQLWTWGSLQLALTAPPSDGTSGEDHLDRLVTAALDAHLGPVNS